MQQFSLSNKSLRFQLMLCVSLISVMIMTSLFVFISMNRMSIKAMGNSYTSNERLNILQKNVSEVEYYMEVYNNYRTYESIDSYYAACVKVEDFLKNMQSKPSENPINQLEYIVQCLVKSFVDYSVITVQEKRAYKDNTKSFEKSLRCYRTLQNAITELNTQLMENNASQYNKKRNRIIYFSNLSILFYSAYFLLILILLYFMITKIIKPLKDISTVAERVADRDFDIPLFNRSGNNEIAKICNAFDKMIISIKEYINTIWEKARTENELREKEMEMQALYSKAQLQAFQSQINPHFLFNTLNTGAQLAMMEGADKTCSFIEQTSDFFRYNLRHQKTTATISEELGIVDNYVYIMKVRFGQRLEFEKNIPDKIFTETLPVMTLQPLVENCIKHGLQDSDTGKVTLTIGENPAYIIITISDNGSGMDEITRYSIMRSRTSDNFSIVSNSDGNKSTGIGLINVYSRLRIYFKRDDVFDIMKNVNGPGTRFIVRIPKNV